MNGRVYDPLLARFGVPDPTTESPFSTQGWNRYSYVGNSPVNFTDPSGYCFLGCFWQPIFRGIQNLFRQIPILGTIVQIAAGFICGPTCAVIASTVIAGITSGKLGLALRAGFITAVTAGAFQIAGDLTGSLGLAGVLNPLLGGHGPLEFMSEAHLFNIAAHALVGCGSALASGGKCGPGALSGAAGSFATPLAERAGFGGGLVITATAGGLASVAGGGKFANGALTAAFGYLFNEFGNAKQRGYEPTVYADGTVCNAGTASGCVLEGAQASSFLEDAALLISGVGPVLRGIFGLGEVAGYTLTRTVAAQAAERPYVLSDLLINEIVATGNAVPDVVPGFMRYTAEGTWWSASWGVETAASRGTYELVIDPKTNTVVHFLFRSGG
jgi:hypothetical protein